MHKVMMVVLAGLIALMVWAICQPAQIINLEIVGDSQWSYTCQKWKTECVQVNCVDIALPQPDGTILFMESCDQRCEVVRDGDPDKWSGNENHKTFLYRSAWIDPKLECTVTNDGPYPIMARLTKEVDARLESVQTLQVVNIKPMESKTLTEGME